MKLGPNLVLSAALCALPACRAARVEEPQQRVNELIREERYDEAVRYAARQAEERPDDPEAQALHRGASVAWYLEQGRQQTFDDRDEEALATFELARDLDPVSSVVMDWIDKTNRKLATKWLDRGLELHADDKLEAAIDAYEQSLVYVPENTSALAGMAQAVLVINHRKGLSEKYYNEGMHALSDYWLEQARARFAYSDKYQENERTDRRLEQVDELLGAGRVVVGLELEKEGRFGAARNEFRLAAALDPENAEAQTGLERTSIEAKASAKLEEGRLMILRGEFETAEALFAEGEALTVRQKDLFEGARVDIAEARLYDQYVVALNLEKDFLYPQAVDAYAAILAQAEYYRDVLTRKNTLEEYVQRAEELYAEAQAAPDAAARLELLRQIEIFWPDYRDISAEIGRLAAEAGQTPDDG